MTSIRLIAVAAYCLGSAARAQAGDAPAETWQVEIHLFSGVANPVFILDASEVKAVQRAFASARAIDGDDASPLPATLGYRGLTLRRLDAAGAVTQRVRLSRGRFAVSGPDTPARFAPRGGIDLERFLLDKALAKGVLPRDVYDVATAGAR